MMDEMGLSAPEEPWERLAREELSRREERERAAVSEGDELPNGHGLGGLRHVDTPPFEPPREAPSESTRSDGTLGDASRADTPDGQAWLGDGSEGGAEDSEEAADEVPDQAGPVPGAQVTEPEEAAGLVSANSMWQRAIRMFTGGTGAPTHSGMDSVDEPAANELLLIVDDTANDLFDAAERGELQLTAGPLDRVDTRGYLLADVHGRRYISAEDAATIGKRAQERVNGKKTGVRKEKAAIEKATYLKVYKARAAAAADDAVAETVALRVQTIEAAAEAQLAQLLSKQYDTLFKDISLKRKRVAALPPRPSADEFRRAWSETREAEAAWAAACDTRACAGEKQDTACVNLENFWERVKDKRRISDSQEAVGDRLVARCEAAVAAFESAEEKLAAATAALVQATGKLQQTRDAVMAGDDPEAEPTLATLEYLKIAEAVGWYLAGLAQRQAEYADEKTRECKEEIAEMKRKRVR